MSSQEGVGISPAEFDRFRHLIHDTTGIHLSDAKRTLLVGRLGKRLRQLGMSSYDQYYQCLTQAGAHEERQVMVDLMTTNETYFFREESHFDFLRKLVSSHPAGQSLDVWSAASSTGEEAYTVCMVLADELGLESPWSVTGTDISRSVLGVAQQGHYDLHRTRGLPREYLHRYCLKGIRSQEGTFIIDKRLRVRTRFLQANLKGPLPDMGRFDVIFLRNVMIYFDTPTKMQVVAALCTYLRPGGHFIVGHSETLHGLGAPLKQVQPTIYQKPA